MLVSFHLIAFLVHEYFTSEWQKNVPDITREIVSAMLDADEVFYLETPAFFFTLVMFAFR